MPLLIQCDALQPGMRLAESLVSDGRVLLKANKVITHSDCDVLRRKYPELMARVGDPILDEMIEFEDDSQEREVAQTIQGKVVKSMSAVRERFSSRASLEGMDFQAIHESINDVLEYLAAHPVSAAMLRQSLDANNYLAEHSGNVFYLSLLLGSAVRDYIGKERQRQTNARHLLPSMSMSLRSLALGSMFMDIGMLPLQHLYKKDEPLTDEERQLILEHPTGGAEMVGEHLPPVAKMVIRTHHENFDGSGYPKGVPGEENHVFTRIVRIADSFASATATSIYKEAKSSARAMWEMTVGPYERFYDPVLMKVFARLIQPFPIGAKLRLLDGRYAVVARYNRKNPFLPTVVVAFDSNGDRLPDDQMIGPVSLSRRRDLRIRSFGGEDIRFIYKKNMFDQEDEEWIPHDPNSFRTMFETAFP